MFGVVGEPKFDRCSVAGVVLALTRGPQDGAGDDLVPSGRQTLHRLALPRCGSRQRSIQLIRSRLRPLRFGSPQPGAVSLSEIARGRGEFGLPVERDLHF